MTRCGGRGQAGAGPGRGAVGDRSSTASSARSTAIQKQGASYGYTHKRGYHPIIAARADTGEVLHIRNRKGKANTQRGAERFVDELLARVRRAGHDGPIVIRADSGFENHKIMQDARRIKALSSRSASSRAKHDPDVDRADPRDRLDQGRRTIPRPGRHKSPRPSSVTGGWSCAAPAWSARRPSYGPTGATTASRPTAPSRSSSPKSIIATTPPSNS